MNHSAKALKALSLLICVILLLSVPRNAQAQDEPVHSLHDGAWALQFSVGQNFVLHSFLGESVSAKKHVSDSRAWEVGVTIRVMGSSVDRSSQNQDARQGSGFISARMLHVWYPGRANRSGESIHWFIGAGPRVSFGRNADTSDRPGGEVESRGTTLGAGVSGVIGAEWFVREQISLFATYGTGIEVSRTSARSEQLDEPDIERTENSFALQSDGVRFGVSVYL